MDPPGLGTRSDPEFSIMLMKPPRCTSCSSWSETKRVASPYRADMKSPWHAFAEKCQRIFKNIELNVPAHQMKNLLWYLKRKREMVNGILRKNLSMWRVSSIIILFDERSGHRELLLSFLSYHIQTFLIPSTTLHKIRFRGIYIKKLKAFYNRRLHMIAFNAALHKSVMADWLWKSFSRSRDFPQKSGKWNKC